MAILLWLVAVALAIWGIWVLVHGGIILGIILLVLACAVGPGGWSITRNRL